MKHYLTICFLFAVLFTVKSQNYVITQNAYVDEDYWNDPKRFVHFTGASTISNTVNLPFGFNFYGYTYNSLKISEHGFLTFNPNTTGNSNNVSLPSTSAPLNSIFVVWEDFNDNFITSRTYGLSPNRIFEVHWSTAEKPGSSGNMNFQVRLYESCGDFDVVIYNNTISPAVSATVGCQNASGTVGVSATGSPNIAPTNGLTVYHFHYNTLRGNEAALAGLQLNNHLPVGSHPLRGSIKNTGVNNITSCKLAYKIDNGSPIITNLTGLNILPEAFYDFSFTTPLSITNPGEQHTLQAWISEVNGTPEVFNCNDTLSESYIGVLGTSGTKKVLVEENTGTWCGYCIDGAVILDEIEAAYPNDVIIVSTHDGLYDPMADERRLIEDFALMSFPGALINRKPRGSGWQNESFGRGSWLTEVASERTEYTPLEISFDTKNWDPTTRTVSGTMKIDYKDYSLAENTGILLMIVEDSLSGLETSSDHWDQANNYSSTPGHPYYNAGGSVAGFIHRHVFRKFINSERSYGSSIGMSRFYAPGQSYTQTFSYTLPDAYNPNRCKLVAAVAEFNKYNSLGYHGPQGNRVIYNSTQIAVVSGITGVSSSILDLGIKVYPNPSTDYIDIEFSNGSVNSVAVYDLIGSELNVSELVNNQVNRIDLQILVPGIYLLKFSNSKGEIVGTTKIIKQ